MAANFITQLNGARFLAQRAIDAEAMVVTPPEMFVLPGGLVPITADRLEAHQEERLTAAQIVEYENAHFLKSNVRIRERYAQWVNREYDAMVRVERELQAVRAAKEAQVAAEYQRRLAEILAAKDANA